VSDKTTVTLQRQWGVDYDFFSTYFPLHAIIGYTKHLQRHGTFYWNQARTIC
jgi:hypothetical protein